MKLSSLLKGIDVLRISGDDSGDVPDICYDSRKCGRGSVFVAIAGAKYNGHDFVRDAVKRGAGYIVHDEDIIPAEPGAVYVRVKDSRLSLGRLGRNFYGNPAVDLCMIGVTGTNGKTTVAYLLESILQSAGFCTGVTGTVNYRYGGNLFPASHTTPESLDLHRMLRKMTDVGVTHVVMEVSSHAIDLKRIDECEYDIGIFTNLSREHLDYHRTMEEYFQVKKRFFADVSDRRVAVVNGDDQWGARLLDEIKTPSITFGVGESNDVSSTDFNLSMDGIDAIIKGPGGEFPVFSAMVGRFNLYNVLAAVATAISLRIPEKYIQSGLAALKTVPGRLERVGRPGEPAVFVDYAHTGDALGKVLENLADYKKGRIITVFGCGGDRDRTKRPVMGKIATRLSDLTIITSDNPRMEDPTEIIDEIVKGIDSRLTKYSPEAIINGSGEKGYLIISDRRNAIEQAVSIAAESDIVLVAGKGHEDYQIMGTRKFVFDDRVVVREALSSRNPGGEH
ncbi:MAG: UDP-N-acetylmuramoyl-L-alanyl-D-glutamate--2,6-diaminopimelate ligase [Thermodesulfobacteriota bacterium]|nr:UDP-N-acetylmuramoyl-L-alanyl-D-glutamate--2,6-diaminopimelate ligase [Thermodesulfobacteriota bacterium]